MNTRFIALVCSLLFPASGALAQGDASQAGGWAPPPPAQAQPTPPPQQAQGNAQGQWYSQQDQERPPVLGGDVERAPAANESPAAPTGPSDSDHASVVGRMAIGFMGISSIPIATIDGSALGVGTLSAPTVGIRYWVSERMGVDLGLGFAYTSESIETNNGTPDTTVVGERSSFGFALRAGLPYVLHHRAHYKLLVAPRMTLGYASGSEPGLAFNQGVDDLTDGLLFEVGAQVGAEIHFGFMGIPELSLQAGVGFDLSYAAVSADSCTDAACSNITLQNSASGLNVTTSVEGQPWRIFTGAISALYYF